MSEAPKPEPESSGPQNVLWHQSGVGKDGEPFVQLLMGERIICQMDVNQARDHARVVLEAAEAAEQDAFIYDWVINRVGSGQTQALGLLQDFRQYRRERTGKSSGARDHRDWIMPEGAKKP
jgi:hypothetical protein